MIISAFLFSACQSPPIVEQNSNGPEKIATIAVSSKEPQSERINPPDEVPMLTIPLDGPAALTQAEYSGMAWYQDELVLMPQYPQRMSEQEGGILFAIPRQALLDFIQGKSSQPIRPREVPLISENLESTISQFEGFEALAFHDQTAYFTIEAREGVRMMGYLVAGQVIGDLEAIQLHPSSLTENVPQENQSNRSDEAILIADDHILTFFESNGAQVNPNAHATVFNLELNFQGILDLPAVEYRLTDATLLDEQDRFWMMNYFFPGDTDLLPLNDPIRETFGAGATHSQSKTVERLLEFQYTPEGIQLTNTPPIQMQIESVDESRNWEGLVRLDGLGFLVVTDKFPKTIFGFIAYP